MRDRKTRKPAGNRLIGNSLIRKKFGRLPAMSLHAITDYGLNDREIGRYFRVTASSD